MCISISVCKAHSIIFVFPAVFKADLNKCKCEKEADGTHCRGIVVIRFKHAVLGT